MVGHILGFHLDILHSAVSWSISSLVCFLAGELLLTECKDVGSVIEKFVSEHNVGADAWRRTGVLTFDGNTKLPQKVTSKEYVCIYKMCSSVISLMALSSNCVLHATSAVSHPNVIKVLPRLLHVVHARDSP